MFYWVHSHTTHFRPAVTLGFVLVVGTASLKHGLVDTITSSDNAHHGTVGRRDHLLRSGWQLHTRLARVLVVGNNGGIVARRTRQLATVSCLLLQIAHNCSFGHFTHGKNVANGQGG